MNPPSAPSLDKTPDPAAPQTIRPAEAAAMLGVSPATLWRWLRDLPGFPEPNRYRLAGRNVTVWYAADLEEWIATQSDMAWRQSAPAVAAPLFHPDDVDAGRRARWCAYLLALSPFEVFPVGPASDPAATQHLFEYLNERVGQLRANAPKPNLANPELTGYLRTLAHCNDVLAGRALPESPGPHGFKNQGEYRRGIYLSWEVGQ